MAKENGLETLIRLAAVNKIPSKYNLAQFKADKERMALHKRICADLVRIADEHKVPLTYLVYFSVSKEAHRIVNFNKGYAKFDEDKAVAIIRMAKEFAAHNGMRTPNDRVYHAMTAFYERCSTDHDVFAARLETMTPTLKFNLVKDICHALGMQ